jgi:sn-glycerol 3-phosphate transport system permease protein
LNYRSSQFRRYIRLGALHGSILALIALVVSPLVFALLLSTQTVQEVYDVGFLWLGAAGIDNYVTALTRYNLGQYVLNSLLMASIIVVGKLLLSLLAALVLVYYQFRFERLVFFFILFTLMFPVPVRIVPLFELMVDLGWTNSLLAITAPYLADAAAIFLLRQHFRSIPASLAEAAKLDGVGPIKFLFYVLVPMSKGMIAGLGVITFVAAWNQYLWPLLVIRENNRQVVQVGIKSLQSVRVAGQTDWGLVMAGTVITLVVPLVVLLFAHRPILRTFGMETQ